VTSKIFTAAECLAFVERSPAAVAAKDRDEWLALFARYNLVEDPVGSAPQISGIYDSRTGCRGLGRLGRFFDTFIAPNKIRFYVDRDVVCGLHVVRDLTIEITMSPELVVRVPVHLLYELTVEDDVLKIFRLAAHWELWPMLKQQARSGWPFVTVGCASAARLLRHMRVSGMAGYVRALSSVGAAGKEQIARFVHYFNTTDTTALHGLFARPDIEIAFPHAGSRLSIAECARQGGEMAITKLLASGNVVSTTLAYRRADQALDGVAIFELNRRSLRIVALSFYWSQSV
jgi:Nuclear transport factor 2 (NTF2) domain